MPFKLRLRTQPRGNNMNVKCSYDEVIPPHKLIPNPKNPNKHPPEQIDRLAKLIDFQGQRHPVIVSKRSGFVVVGHGRLEAIKKLNWDGVAVNYQDFENEAQEFAFVTSDNAIAEWAELDLALINQEMLDMGPDFDIELLGLKDFVIEPIEKFEPQSDEDDVPDVGIPITTKGDVWIMGNHRLMCGDSTMIDDVLKLMGGKTASITFTSPPYNAGKNIRGNFYDGENTDNKSSDDYTDFLNQFTTNALSVSDFVFVNIQILESNKRSIIEYQYNNIDHIKDILIWNKKQYPPHINKGTFGCKWEYVICFGKNGSSRSFPCSWQGKHSNVIETENNSSNQFAKDHKAGFPVSFPSWVISKMDFAKSVYDPFMGTGTTMIACQNLSLPSFGMELSEKYCDIAVKRWQQFTGGLAKLESTGQTYQEMEALRGTI